MFSDRYSDLDLFYIDSEGSDQPIVEMFLSTCKMRPKVIVMEILWTPEKFVEMGYTVSKLPSELQMIRKDYSNNDWILQMSDFKKCN